MHSLGIKVALSDEITSVQLQPDIFGWTDNYSATEHIRFHLEGCSQTRLVKERYGLSYVATYIIINNIFYIQV